MFFGDLLSPDFFFTHSGQAITRVYKKERYNHIDFNQISHQDNGLWLNSIINSWKVLYDFHHQFHPFVPYHNIDAYTKTGFQRTWHRFENKLLNSDSAFRNSNDIERIIFDLDAIYRGASIIKILPNLSPWKQYVATLVACSIDGMVKDDKPKHLLMVQYIHPKLFCINSAEHSTSKEKDMHVNGIRKCFQCLPLLNAQTEERRMLPSARERMRYLLFLQPFRFSFHCVMPRFSTKSHPMNSKAFS